ncbi:MAG: undecaprenyl-diphosphate phosphatase [candidate division Zixibacteria bacterium]|nr:undecaprenyl-diphosphate phosphatase [candidate division Zixibacteria bacterium]
MSYFDAILLGFIQGLTEFLPVSSSGHLVLAEHLLHTKMPGVAFELVLHCGTLLSVLVYFRRKIWGLLKSFFISGMTNERKLAYYLIIGSIPAGVAGIFFKEFFERIFSSPWVTSAMLVITGVILLATAMVKVGDKNINTMRSLIIGLGQAIAILPGISRSGTTIATGLFAGVNPVTAAEFSFLLSIPAITGAVTLKFKNLMAVNSAIGGQCFVGAVIAFILGLLAIYLLLDIVKRGKFKYFGIYCILVGLFGLVYFV